MSSYDVKDKWWTSPFNWEEEVRKDLSLPPKVFFHDATLRDGEQTPGVVFRKEEKVAIAKKLDEAGVDRIHGCALGIGERVGNTPMELLILTLEDLGWMKPDHQLLAAYVEKVSTSCRVAIPEEWPVKGARFEQV